MFRHPLDFIVLPIQIFSLLLTFYYLLLSFFGLFHRREKITAAPEKSFALVVAAHNEEKVIVPLVQNLQMLDYPRHLFEVFVVADNCTDQTAKLAREAGAIVYERFDEKNRGKGFALEWMFNHLFRLPRAFDAVVIFDADNLVAPDFLRYMNQRLRKGEKIIQGYVDAKNPKDTWVAGAFAISFWVVNRLWHLAKYNMGLSTALGGTGMCIATDVLRKHGWGATSLTEDLEFSMKALLVGERTTWCHEARVYDEKPLTFAQSWRQRTRWAQGQVDVATRFTLPLLWRGLTTGDFRLLDGALHAVQPLYVIVITTFMLLTHIPGFVRLYTPIFNMVLPAEAWIGIMIFQYALPFLCLLLDRTPIPLLGVIGYPVFINSWIPLTFIGLIRKNRREWSHTIHTRSISYQELADAKMK